MYKADKADLSVLGEISYKKAEQKAAQKTESQDENQTARRSYAFSQVGGSCFFTAQMNMIQAQQGDEAQTIFDKFVKFDEKGRYVQFFNEELNSNIKYYISDELLEKFEGLQDVNPKNTYADEIEAIQIAYLVDVQRNKVRVNDANEPASYDVSAMDIESLQATASAGFERRGNSQWAYFRMFGEDPILAVGDNEQLISESMSQEEFERKIAQGLDLADDSAGILAVREIDGAVHTVNLRPILKNGELQGFQEVDSNFQHFSLNTADARYFGFDTDSKGTRYKQIPLQEVYQNFRCVNFYDF